MALGGKASDRKLRLFAVACCRRIWDSLRDEAGRNAVEVAERFADGRATAEELDLAAEAVSNRHDELEEELNQADVSPPQAVRHFNAVEAAYLATWDTYRLGMPSIWGNVDWARERDGAEYPPLCGLLRDIFGNPFRPTTLAATTPTVAYLAQAAYGERDMPSGELDPQRLSVLADALEEIGAGADVVAHLRGPGPHVRGCCAVDLCLGKA